MINLYVFQWISDLGGADTRLKELLILLKDNFTITCIPNDSFRLKEKHNTDFLDLYGIKYCMTEDLPKKLDGYAYANCNFRLFKEKHRIDFIKDSGLKFLWSNDMMWTNTEELAAIKANKVDCCLFTSEFHKDVLNPKIQSTNPKQKTFIIENYFDADTWPLVDRPDRTVVCGKVSRNDVMKFSENFPIFYESACSKIKTNFKIMGWDDKLANKYSWYKFDNRWEFLKPNAKDTREFLQSIDIFLYNCNHKFIENQSRAIVEAQLTGCPIVAPNMWNFPNMIWDKRTGFLWNNLEELQDIMVDLSDYRFRTKVGRFASYCTREVWCDREKALNKFNSLLNFVEN
jgi:glycosyltransferase involved in cell wall biosynthesis